MKIPVPRLNTFSSLGRCFPFVSLLVEETHVGNSGPMTPETVFDYDVVFVPPNAKLVESESSSSNKMAPTGWRQLTT